MKTLLISLTTALFLTWGSAGVHADDDRKPTAQQQRMTDCNKDAGEKKLKGEERRKFMSTCLKGDGAATGTGSSQQDKMKHCNKEAGDKQLKGDARKKFMRACLKG